MASFLSQGIKLKDLKNSNYIESVHKVKNEKLSSTHFIYKIRTHFWKLTKAFT